MERARVEAAARTLADAGVSSPEVAIILGSGLGPLADMIDVAVEVRTTSIEGYPPSTVEGHEGVFIFGDLNGRKVLALKGRIHAYEGHPLDVVVLPVRMMARLGARTIVLTNAAGGIRPDLRKGDVMLIEDHLNLQPASPLEGPNVEEWGPRFPDMTEAWDPELRKIARQVASEDGLELQAGVYASLRGPQYETPAEVRMLARLGADAVGMSTVPEVIAARHMGMRAVGFSLISNVAAGLGEGPLDHREVVEAGRERGEALSSFTRRLIARL